jgi:hypothetical protein
MTFPEMATQKILDSGGKLKVKSALNPALWLCAIITAPIVISILLFKLTPPIWLITIIFIPVICAAIGFLFLLFFDRDKLQSEDYQIRKRSLELIEQKGHKFLITENSINAITNPQLPQLPDKYKKEEGE